MADPFKKLSDIDYTTVTKDKLNSYYRAAVKKFGKGSKEASEYGKAMAKAYQVNKGVMPKAKANQQQTRTPTKPTKSTKPTKPTASDKAVKGGYAISPENRKPGTRGSAVQPKAKPKKNVRGSGVKKTGKKIDLGKTLKNLSDNFKLTRKAGEVFTVGNMRYVSDGKGGIRSSQRIR